MTKLLLPSTLLLNVAMVLSTEMDDERLLAKPWYNRELHPMFPLSPTTVACAVIAFFYLLSVFFGGPTSPAPSAEASHILLSKGDHPERVLTNMKTDIQNDASKFAALARRYSECPSGTSTGGSLGTFGKNTMAPPFDKAVFDPSQTDEGIVGKVIGPIQTQFGWHLILVHKRQM